MSSCAATGLVRYGWLMNCNVFTIYDLLRSHVVHTIRFSQTFRKTPYMRMLCGGYPRVGFSTRRLAGLKKVRPVTSLTQILHIIMWSIYNSKFHIILFWTLFSDLIGIMALNISHNYVLYWYSDLYTYLPRAFRYFRGNSGTRESKFLYFFVCEYVHN